MLEVYNQHHEAEDEMHLPPIEPPTPSLKDVRKILQNGDHLASKAKMGFIDDPIPESPRDKSPRQKTSATTIIEKHSMYECMTPDTLLSSSSQEVCQHEKLSGEKNISLLSTAFTIIKNILL